MIPTKTSALQKGIFLFYLWTLFDFTVASKTNFYRDAQTCCDLSRLVNTTDCPTMILDARINANFGFTPNFPEAFPINKKCVWTIRAPMGMRVRLEFRDFYLIGPGENGGCFSQSVIVRAPVTGKSMGPFCGNAGIPTIISEGNLLSVELEAPVPLSDENYRGFRMAYMETLETPSHALAGDTSREKEINKLIPTPPSASDATPIITKTRYTQKPSRWIPTRKPFMYTTRKPYKVPAISDIIHNRDNQPVWTETKNNIVYAPDKGTKSVKPEIIIGAVVGGIIFIALLALIMLKIYQIRQAKKMKGKSDSENEMYEYSSPESIKKDKPVDLYYIEAPKKDASKKREKEKTTNSHHKPAGKKSTEEKSRNQKPSHRKKVSLDKKKTTKESVNNKNKTTTSTANNSHKRKATGRPKSPRKSEETKPSHQRKRIHVYEDVDVPYKSSTVRSTGKSSRSSNSLKKTQQHKRNLKTNQKVSKSSSGSADHKKKKTPNGRKHPDKKSMRTRSFVQMREKYRRSKKK